MILTIMNKVQHRVELLCSIIGIGNNRLEQLALDKCHELDLSFDYFDSPHETFFERFHLQVMPRICNNIQSLILNIEHVPDIVTFAKENCVGTFPNLTHLKIIIGKRCPKTGTPFTLGKLLFSILFKFCWNIILIFCCEKKENVMS